MMQSVETFEVNGKLVGIYPDDSAGVYSFIIEDYGVCSYRWGLIGLDHARDEAIKAAA